MRKAIVLAGLIAIAPAWPQAQAPATAVPVLVELFTSEGCSSCPPADEVLTRLMGTQPVPGVRIIALGEHVDYWDRKGWRDAFSQALFSRRQSDYAAKGLHGGDIYTPQLVINGERDLVGSDYRAAVAAIVAAAKAGERAQVSLSLDAPPGTARLSVSVKVEPLAGATLKKSDVWLALVENGLTTKVGKGENGGRTLQHTAVVRTLQNLGAIPGTSSWSGEAALAISADWKRPALHLVAFVQDRSSRRVLGAVDAPLN